MKNIPLYDLPGDQMHGLGFKLYHLKSRNPFAENLSSIPLQTNVPHRHRFYEICFFIKEGGLHEIDFQTFTIKALSIHFLSPGQVHLLSNTQENQGYVFAFTPEFLLDNTGYDHNWLLELPYFNPLLNEHILELTEEDHQYIMTLLRHVIADYSAIGEKAKEIIQAYLKILLLKCKFLHYRQQKNTRISDGSSIGLINKFKHLVEKHFQSLHQVQQYSDILCISPSHLNKCCKELTGTTASDLIIQRLILEAKRLLSFTEKSSKEIAFHLQFEDPAYFSRIFRKKTGFTPTSFRENVREKYQA